MTIRRDKIKPEPGCLFIAICVFGIIFLIIAWEYSVHVIFDNFLVFNNFWSRLLEALLKLAPLGIFMFVFEYVRAFVALNLVAGGIGLILDGFQNSFLMVLLGVVILGLGMYVLSTLRTSKL